MRRAVLVLSVVVAGCNNSTTLTDKSEAFFPLMDGSNEAVTLRHAIEVVKGNVFHFGEDGSRLIHHFVPVATISDSNTYVIEVSSELSMGDFMRTSFDAEDEVASVIKAAEIYCAETNYNRFGNGVSILVEPGRSLLVEFCIPEGILLPLSYKNGDRVPR